ncbi:hypothetical protein Tco_0106012 [Tanacetum coccineum]
MMSSPSHRTSNIEDLGGNLVNISLEIGFTKREIDKTLFINKHKDDYFAGQVLYDDIIFGSTKNELCIAFEKLMHEKILDEFYEQNLHSSGLQVFTEVKTASTPMETQKPLLKDEDGEEVDVHMYRSMIGSLMYLTSSRPDIMFAVCACARYQVNPKVSHLHVVKRIFRYLKGQPKLGLWYLKDSPFDLVAYTDSDYAGASLDKKSTTRGCQFLRCRLISWQCKKQTVVANSITEAEYVAASSCCGQVASDRLRDALSVIFGLSVTQDTVMSDSEDSTVTYTQISSPFTDLSNIGSPGVDGPPIMPDDKYAYVVAAFPAPPSLDYVLGPEEPQGPLPLDFVLEPVYLEFMPPDDEVLPEEEQPLHDAALPTNQSPGYIPKSDSEEDLEEDDKDEEDPADYPADRDDDDEDEEEPSGDDVDDEDEDKDEDEEEEEHPALADSVPPVHRMTARISIRAEPSISLPPREEDGDFCLTLTTITITSIIITTTTDTLTTTLTHTSPYFITTCTPTLY